MHDNRARRYALESWTVEKKRRGWCIKRTHAADEWRGPLQLGNERVPHDRAASASRPHPSRRAAADIAVLAAHT
jgi:hypothetical protein